MRFDTEINGVIYSVDGELEGDHETPYVDIQKIEFWHCRIDKIISIPLGHFERFYERFKGIIDQDAIGQADWDNEN